MEDRKSDDWLPPGWKVEVRQRRNGRKDKCYYAPDGEHRFISRAEVTRYLEKEDSKAEVKEKVPSKQSPKNVMVEKVDAEGLPPGWTKEVKITKKGNKVRKDPFYTDPVSGYVFRSMKDALRYVETGELGKFAFKPKEKESNGEDPVEDNICEPVIVESQKVTVNGTTDETERQIAEHVSNSSGITKEEMLTSTSTGEQTSLSKRTPDQRKGAESSSLNLSEDKGSEQTGPKDSEGVDDIGMTKDETEKSQQGTGKAKLKKALNTPRRASKDSEEGVHDNGMTKDQTEKTQQGTGKTKKLKKALNTPRRASKRLAGVALDPTPEPKATKALRSSTKRLSVAPDAAEKSSTGNCIERPSKQLDLPESSLKTNFALDAYKSKEPVPATSNVLSSGDMPTVNGYPGSLETKTNGNKDKSVLLPGNFAISGEHSGKLESYDKASDEPGSAIDMPPIADLWTDPCIAFAIQTLTGIPCDTPKISESNSGQGSGIQSTKEAQVNSQGCGIYVPPTDPGIWKEHALKVETGHKTDETVGSSLETSLETPLADIFADPCIEFAIKTLTGAIPVEYGLDSQHGLQQQPSSTLNQSSNHLTLPNVGINKFSQTEFMHQQYDVAGKSMSKEHGISRNPIYNYSHLHRSGERP